MDRRAPSLLLLLAAACTRLGGTPGPPALRCVPSTEVCDDVNAVLERARENVGGWCGTPYVGATQRLVMMGPHVAPYLMKVLSDRDVEVAEVAADALVHVGQGERLAGWCRRHPTYANAPRLCREIDQRVEHMRAVTVGGVWLGEAHRCNAPGVTCKHPRKGEALVRLELRTRDGAVDGELCVPLDDCRRVTGRLDGFRLELSDGVTTLATHLGARLFADYGPYELVLDPEAEWPDRMRRKDELIETIEGFRREQ